MQGRSPCSLIFQLYENGNDDEHRTLAMAGAAAFGWCDSGNETRMKITLTGMLKRGGLQIGGESTGWVLQTDTPDEIEVDVSGVMEEAEILNGNLVAMAGHFVIEDYIERRPVKIFFAETLCAA